MHSPRDSGLKIAELLLNIQAVKINPEQPFRWASGWHSPIYCDNRLTLSHPEVRTAIRDAFVERIGDSFGTPDAIAGVATGAIAHGALVADAMNLPFVYVRSQAKGHGLGNRIEGRIEAGRKVVVLEDLVSTGGSSLSAVQALRDAGVEVLGMAAIFTYGFDVARRNFEAEDCKLVTLTDYNQLLSVATHQKNIRSEDLESLRAWRHSPETWGT